MSPNRQAAVRLALTEWLLLLAIPLLAAVLWAITTEHWVILSVAIVASVAWAVTSLIVTRTAVEDEVILDLTTPEPRIEPKTGGSTDSSRAISD
jgi:hypothetical protein